MCSMSHLKQIPKTSQKICNSLKFVFTFKIGKKRRRYSGQDRTNRKTIHLPLSQYEVNLKHCRYRDVWQQGTDVTGKYYNNSRMLYMKYG